MCIVFIIFGLLMISMKDFCSWKVYSRKMHLLSMNQHRMENWIKINFILLSNFRFVFLISLYLLKLKNENNIFCTFDFNFFTVHQLCLTHEPCMRKLDGPLETFWSFSWWPRGRHLNEILKNTMEKKKFHLFPAWKTTLNRDSWGNGRFGGV